ncbi:MAG: hypothetical protein IPI49_23050 [Myxococcales bacterium]|nr:hypothetical protein [Myxococcales bacterium]
MSEPTSPQDARALERIEKALGGLGGELKPPAGWEARVMAGRAAERAWWSWSIPLVAVAAAALLILWLRQPAQPTMQLALEVSHGQGETKVRGDQAQDVHLGDSVAARVKGRAHRALWFYLNDQLLLACPQDPACNTDDPEQLRATWQPKAVGKYVVVALSSAQAIPAPTGSLDADLAAAINARAELLERRFEVR